MATAEHCKVTCFRHHFGSFLMLGTRAQLNPTLQNRTAQTATKHTLHLS